MNEFEIISPDREDIEIVFNLPEKYSKFKLSGTTPIMAHCSFGDMLFHHYKGEGFDIWKSNYLIERDATVIGRYGHPVLEFTVMYENSVDIDWTGITKSRVPVKLIDMFYVPYVENKASFKGGKQFSTVDFHFYPSFLESYSRDFPILAEFMEQVSKGEPARLFDGTQFATPQLDALIKNMITFSIRDDLASNYYESYINIILIHLLEKISGFNPALRKFSAKDIEIAYEARRLLTTNLEESYTINKLCRILQTNPFKLKTTFKYLFGSSIGKYKKGVLMEYAKQLLLSTDYSLDEIALRLGYNSEQSFNTAFRNYYNRTPGTLRKKKF